MLGFKLYALPDAVAFGMREGNLITFEDIDPFYAATIPLAKRRSDLNCLIPPVHACSFGSSSQQSSGGGDAGSS